MRVIILGSGASTGVPSIATGWGKCSPQEPKNHRTRPSILIEDKDVRFLVDTSPDLRSQLIQANVKRLDAVFYTHAHADHVNGIDDLRGINQIMGKALPAYGDHETLQKIREKFDYAFSSPSSSSSGSGFYKPALIPHELKINGTASNICGISVRPFPQDHGFSQTIGFRFNNLAYTTDVVALKEEVFQILSGVKVWIIGVFTDRPHKTHVHVSKALEWINKIKPDRAVFTHLGTSLDYNALNAILPKNVETGFDGMIIDIPL